ncbi:unnamed protein product [Gulo gulo]|uniref:Uncharacterized protein n=1 Tax=Gulo gulo TaxID=48420 RepID=A0A9X9Q3C1_GULGU|nr:unnamed protein product [Gulo gulo]
MFTGDFPSLELRHVSTWLQHVVTIPSINWHKYYCVGVVANLLNVSADFFNDFLISLLAVGWLSGIHFVNTNVSWLSCVSQKGMLMGLPIVRDTHFKFTNTSSNNQDSTVSLRCACHHVLFFFFIKSLCPAALIMVILAGLEFPQGLIIGETMFMFTFSLSKTQTYLKESIPISAASYSNFSIVLSLTPPYL